MSTRTTAILSTIIVVAMLIASALVGQFMPEQIAMHWNSQGQVDGYGNTFEGLFFLPLLTLGVIALMIALPNIDPRKASYQAFRGTYNLFILGMALFMAYMHAAAISWNLGVQFDFTQAIFPPLAALFVGIGFLMRGAKPNWFVGIRTPWTLSNDRVWEKTHSLGAKVFWVCGGVVLLCMFLPGELPLAVLMGAIFISGTLLFIYSYVVYRQEKTQ